MELRHLNQIQPILNHLVLCCSDDNGCMLAYLREDRIGDHDKKFTHYWERDNGDRYELNEYQYWCFTPHPGADIAHPFISVLLKEKKIDKDPSLHISGFKIVGNTIVKE